MKATPGQTILIVDDDSDFLMQQELVLRAAGYDVVRAESRSGAEAVLRDRRPDAAIVDLMMDESDDGFVLCYSAKKRYPNMPVIMVTNVAGETGMEFGTTTAEERNWIKADALLIKPVRPEQILGELRRLLRGG